jgi:hypothetical protein
VYAVSTAWLEALKIAELRIQVGQTKQQKHVVYKINTFMPKQGWDIMLRLFTSKTSHSKIPSCAVDVRKGQS